MAIIRERDIKQAKRLIIKLEQRVVDYKKRLEGATSESEKVHLRFFIDTDTEQINELKYMVECHEGEPAKRSFEKERPANEASLSVWGV